ncbi:hypothetical protein AVEN_234324-1 [Araneus ventricosus]|uniref:Uncharacterized protein n=1 Tax=Araneus ventricosus TaxID=182803 RepID=A0A4Y2A8J0_ARAVE|nr:hypothetical protein AVEN_234324-1 [Araneus ventricosus]
MGLDFAPASTSGMGAEFAQKTLESQFRFFLLTGNDAFFIIEVLWVQIVLDVNDSSLQSLIPTACGLTTPRVARGLYLWTVVGEIRTVAPFLRRVGLQISRQRSSERMH